MTCALVRALSLAVDSVWQLVLAGRVLDELPRLICGVVRSGATQGLTYSSQFNRGQDKIVCGIIPSRGKHVGSYS